MKFKIVLIILIIYCLQLTAFANRKSAVDLFKEAENMQDFEIAERNYKTIISEYPTSIYAAQAIYKLADMNFLRNNFIEAAEYYLKIIREYNSEEIYANSLFNYALSLYMLGKLDESEKILKEYLSKFPKDDDRKYEIYIKLGDINYNRGNIAQALEQYQNSLLFFEKNKLKSWAYYQIGNCYNYAKQINEAFIAYMTVVKFFPNSVEYYQALEAIEKLKTNNKLVDYKIWQENNPTYKFFIQVGAFKNKANAEKLLNDYSKKKEFNQKIIRILQDGDLYKVRIGNFFSYEEAQKFKRENKLSGFILTE